MLHGNTVRLLAGTPFTSSLQEWLATLAGAEGARANRRN